jgi:hypothetical protein
VEIEWPPFPPDGVLERPATLDDIGSGLAAFVLPDPARRVELGLPRLGHLTGDGERQLGVVIQTEATEQGQVLVGVRHVGGSFSVCTPKDFDAAPRFLVLFRLPGFGIDEAQRALQEDGLSVARMRDVLAVRCDDGPVLFGRYAEGRLAAEELTGATRHTGQAAALEACDSLFEVSFLDLEEVLDEINTLIMAQDCLQERTHGFVFLEWNKSFNGPENP